MRALLVDLKQLAFDYAVLAYVRNLEHSRKNPKEALWLACLAVSQCIGANEHPRFTHERWREYLLAGDGRIGYAQWLILSIDDRFCRSKLLSVVGWLLSKAHDPGLPCPSLLAESDQWIRARKAIEIAGRYRVTHAPFRIGSKATVPAWMKSLDDGMRWSFWEFAASLNVRSNPRMHLCEEGFDLAEGNGGFWEEDGRVPISDWVAQVVDDSTRLGYWEFVAHSVAAEG